MEFIFSQLNRVYPVQFTPVTSAVYLTGAPPGKFNRALPKEFRLYHPKARYSLKTILSFQRLSADGKKSVQRYFPPHRKSTGYGTGLSPCVRRLICENLRNLWIPFRQQNPQHFSLICENLRNLWTTFCPGIKTCANSSITLVSPLGDPIRISSQSGPNLPTVHTKPLLKYSHDPYVFPVSPHLHP